VYVANPGITDLAGNALVSFTSNFTTGATADTSGLQVVGVSP